VVPGKYEVFFGGESGVVEPLSPGVAGGCKPAFGSMEEKSLPKKPPGAGAAGFAGSSLAVPSLVKVVPSLKPPARPLRPEAGWGVGVASSRLRDCVSAPLSVEANEEVVLKDEVVVFWPKTELDCCAGVLDQDGKVDPLPEFTVTVDPKLGSAFKPAGAEAVFGAPPNADFCCPRPPKPD
jgi:hypothetical protein